MVRPVIGIPCRVIEDTEYEIPAQGNCEAYVESIIAAGGSPILIPLLKNNHESVSKYIELCNGMLFTGGEDVGPERYNALPDKELKKVSLERDELEFALFKEAFEARKPILGVCRGHQLINVALGGTLIQDIPSLLATTTVHGAKDEKWIEILHSIECTTGSRLEEILGAGSLPTNSIHHQCIDRLGKGLVVSARCVEDGVVEGVESEPGGPWLVAVQWHPEVLWQAQDAGGAGIRWNLNLFTALVNAAREPHRD